MNKELQSIVQCIIFLGVKIYKQESAKKSLKSYIDSLLSVLAFPF